LKYQNLLSVPNFPYLFQWQPKVVVPSHLYFSIVFIYYWICSRFEYAWNICGSTWQKNKTINSQL